VNNQIRSMMRLEDRIKKKWKQSKKKIIRNGNSPYASSGYNYSSVKKDDLKKGLDKVVECFIQAIREETAKLQREEHKENLEKKEN